VSSRPLNATAASLLGFLHEGPKTGWDLVATAQARIGDFWSLTQSQVYRELAAMAESGLIAAGERGVRDRQPYTLTDTGRAAFAEWIDQEPGPETIRFPLLLTIGFGRYLAPDRLATFIEHHRADHAAQLHAYERLREAVASGEETIDEYGMATLTFGLEYEGAVVAWFDALPAAIAGRAEKQPTAELLSTAKTRPT
jgi:DNA-binding PadR family transcriptional regulator